MTDELERLAGVVHRASGITLRPAQRGSLTAALRRVDPALRPHDLLDVEDPIRRARLLDLLVDELTINETFFLRHAEELLRIDWAALAASAAAGGRKVRVWSAACSSGEEVYTLALLAAEALGAAAPVDVLGTDLSFTALERAEQSVYGRRSMRLVSADQRDRWFEAIAPDSHRVGAGLRALVRFERHNLIRDPIPPGGEIRFDLIVCRNVLIYFDRDDAARTIRALREALTPGGELILGTADRLGSADTRPEAPTPAVTPKPRRAARRARPVAAPAAKPAPPPSTGTALDAFEAGMRALEAGDVVVAVGQLRRALYLEPALAVAALQLGRAHEAAGDAAAARRAYWRALRLAEAADDPAARLYDRVGAGDVAAACRARLAALQQA